VAHRKVTKARAVRVSAGSIRSAAVSGVFELAPDAVGEYTTPSGTRRVVVACLWYLRKPPTSWMHLTVTGTCTLLENYTGEVVANIGR